MNSTKRVKIGDEPELNELAQISSISEELNEQSNDGSVQQILVNINCPKPRLPVIKEKGKYFLSGMVIKKRLC